MEIRNSQSNEIYLQVDVSKFLSKCLKEKCHQTKIAMYSLNFFLGQKIVRFSLIVFVVFIASTELYKISNLNKHSFICYYFGWHKKKVVFKNTKDWGPKRSSVLNAKWTEDRDRRPPKKSTGCPPLTMSELDASAISTSETVLHQSENVFVIEIRGQDWY